MKTTTSPVARAAPSMRPWVTPSLLLLLINFTSASLDTYSLSEDFRYSAIDKTIIRIEDHGLEGVPQTGKEMQILFQSFTCVFLNPEF